LKRTTRSATADSVPSIPLKQSGCIQGDGSLKSNGYRVRWSNGKLLYAHRIAWEEKVGPIPPGGVIHHRCENKQCVNVRHLMLLTQSEHGKLHYEPIFQCPRCGSTERAPVRTRPGKTYCVPCARGRARARAKQQGWPKHKDHRVGSPRIPCECGCGTLIPSKRMDGKPARFSHGHNPHR
jgi:hypothetical protein